MAGAQPHSAHLIIDDQDLDDAELWAAVDSAAAASLSSSHKPRRPPLLAITNTASVSRSPNPADSRQPAKTLGRTPQSRRPRMEESRASPDGEVVEENPVRPSKVARFSGAVMLRPLQQQSPVVTFPSPYSSPDVRGLAVQEMSPAAEMSPSAQGAWGGHSMSGPFPSVTLFKQYQNAAMAILEKCDYTMVSGRPYIKKSGWRKISFYFNLSYEIRDKSIEFDDDRNVLRAEFTVRALMQGGRFADGWGSCERREKRFIKPNHDIPSIAETRAKNKACQDLLGIGEYRPGAGSELY